MDTADISISPDELARLLGGPRAPLLLDVRREAAFAGSRRMIASAVRCAPENVAGYARSGPPREVVVYCVFGHAVSREAALTLRAAGWNARLLAGGLKGGEDGVDAPEAIAAWRAAALPVLRKRPDLGVSGERPSRWITRDAPKVDRVACPWLIRRFIDPHAGFFYVPADRVLEEARRLGGVAYDIEGTPISHRRELCSFDALLDAFELRLPALAAMAAIVRAADTNRCTAVPQAAGLLAISLGLSRLHAGDDQAMLAAAMPIYDALHAWCRDGQGEAHSWRAHDVSGSAP